MWGINYMLVHLGMPVAELVLAVRISERVVLQKCMGYLEKKIRVDVWGFCVVVGIAEFSWGDVGEDCFCDGWLAILEMCPIDLFLVGRFMFIVKFFDEKN